MVLVMKKSGGAVSMADFFGQLQKGHGGEVGSCGGKLAETDRIPTGLFPLDLAMAGGFPRGTVSMVYGPESSGKTNLILRAIAMHQKLWPQQINMFVDVEHSFDPAWARKLGVDTDQLLVARPSYGEQLVHMVECALLTNDCGIVAIDSLAAILTEAEVEASAEQSSYGGSSILMARLCRRTTSAIAQANKAGRHPTLFYINQVRSKVGVYGNSERIAGGNAPKFQANVILRVDGSDEMDPKVSKTMPVRKQIKFVLDKWKYPMLATSGTFSMATLPHCGLKVGQCDDFNTVREYLKAFGKFEKAPEKGWMILGEHYDTIDAFKGLLYENDKFGAGVHAFIIDEMVKCGGGVLQATDADTEAALAGC
jgi:recombination protein RecA